LQNDLSCQRADFVCEAVALEPRRFERVEALRLAGRFARGSGDFVDGLPAYRLVAAEPVRCTMPTRPSQGVHEGRIDVPRNLTLRADLCAPSAIGRPNRQDCNRVLALGTALPGVSPAAR
jgi:hypothetical protein